MLGVVRGSRIDLSLQPGGGLLLQLAPNLGVGRARRPQHAAGKAGPQLGGRVILKLFPSV